MCARAMCVCVCVCVRACVRACVRVCVRVCVRACVRASVSARACLEWYFQTRSCALAPNPQPFDSKFIVLSTGTPRRLHFFEMHRRQRRSLEPKTTLWITAHRKLAGVFWTTATIVFRNQETVTSKSAQFKRRKKRTLKGTPLTVSLQNLILLRVKVGVL